MNDLSAEASRPAQDLLGALLSNPELLRNVGALLNTSHTDASPSPPREAETSAPSEVSAPSAPDTAPAISLDGLGNALNDPALMARLPQMIELLRPMLSGGSGEKAQQTEGAIPASASHTGGKRRGREDCRDELLLALKPFLSPERCEAVDAIIRIARLGNVLKTLQ